MFRVKLYDLGNYSDWLRSTRSAMQAGVGLAELVQPFCDPFAVCLWTVLAYLPLAKQTCDRNFNSHNAA